jgi:DNA repair protein RadC
MTPITNRMNLTSFEGNPRRYSLKTIKTSFVVEDGPPDPQVSSASDAIRIGRAIMDTLDANQEHFLLLALNTKNKVYGYKVLFTGGVSASTVDIKIVMRTALFLEAVSFIVFHNHPSGNPYPSQEDVSVTHRLTEAGKLLSIRLLDHIILGEGGMYHSFQESGNLGA